ncbi:WD40-repeat-containing domain protein [Xylariomycetidae sp. FL2044]|nr:WD40-repeat-containing domain protein [Xylariomycetidae sp. FL2044]
MEQFRKRSLAHILSRHSSDGELERGSGTSRPDKGKIEKGPLGLATIHEPDDHPLVDLVLIHGLGGGSRKTWSKTANPLHFWPKSWLPQDPDFHQVRIHSFGYNADWIERRRSILSIHDFAQSFVGELRNHTSIRRDNTRLILVGHSMGGCVAKKAYILARQDVNCKDIASRFHSIFFLATPHRGSDLATVLQNMIGLAWGAKPFVSDLLPNSTTMAEINDAFRHYAEKLVVEKFSATLGYSNEEIAAMDADHRHVCKFDNNLDPNYRKLRNALCTAVDLIKCDAIHQAPRQALAPVKTFLSMNGTAFEDDLASYQELRHPGSCVWLTEQPQVEYWLHADSSTPAMLWLTGLPATGKSVICSYMIDHLRELNVSCSYFFFKCGKDGRSSLVDCFRAIAYQMATQDNSVSQCIMELESGGDSWDPHDERQVWRKLFLQTIFRLSTVSQHVWVIDGFDECSQLSSWFKLASQLPDRLRLFVTSRHTDEIGRGISSLGARARMFPLSTSNTANDIHEYISSRIESLSLGHIQGLSQKICAKSRGSFLWVRLVLQEFENAYTDEDIESILSEVPEALQDLYLQMLGTIENDKRRTKLAISILRWVALACRPLTVDELLCAVKLDIQETPHNLKSTIPTVCGQLVFVDQASRVHMIHETAREFLLREDLDSTLAVKKGNQHGHLALLCCRYLSSGVLRAPNYFRTARAAKPFSAPDRALVEYASRFFSEHLHQSNCEDDTPAYELARFLERDVLHWIERIASEGDISPIASSAINLTSYLRRRSKYVRPGDKDTQAIDAWATDLVKMSAKFRSELLTCPSSIHCLIPPMCPTESIISKTYTSPTRSLVVRGYLDRDWDDCLVRIHLRKGYTTSLACGQANFAVGTSSGQISVYDTRFIQQVSVVKHPERVRVLEFSRKDKYLASAGKRHACVWHPKTGSQIWECALEAPPLAMTFTSPEHLVHVDGDRRLVTNNLRTGETSTVKWDTGAITVPPRGASMSADLGLFAVCYRAHPVLIYDTNNATFLGQCDMTALNGIDAMVFHPDPDISALIVSRQDGDLVIFDSCTMEMRLRKTEVYASTLACSPDGACLLTGDYRGTISVYEFPGYDGNSLSLFYRINAGDEHIRSLALSHDRSRIRIISCQRSQTCVWEPAIPVQTDAEAWGQSDMSSQLTIPQKASGLFDGSESAEITTLICHSDGTHVMCGDSNGDVAIFTTTDRLQQREVLYSHSKSISVVAIALAEPHNLVVTADESARVLVAKLPLSSEPSSRAEILADRRFPGAVFSLLINPANDRLLLLGRECYELWELPSGVLLKTQPLSRDQGRQSVVNHPISPGAYILFSAHTATLLLWADGEEIGESRYQLQRSDSGAAPEKLLHECVSSASVIVETIKDLGFGAATRLYCWDPLLFQGTCDELRAAVQLDLLAPFLRSVVAVVGSTLIFIDRDLWICSLDITTFNHAPFSKRHFFILSEWLNINGQVLCRLTSRNDFIFVNKTGLIAISHGLEFSETITLSPQKNWKVHTGSMHRRTSNSITRSLPRPGDGLRRTSYPEGWQAFNSGGAL